MGLLTSHIERDETFARRREAMAGLVTELRGRTALVARGGGEPAVERHRSRGKLTARERIDLLVDPGGAFLELNALAAWGLYDGDAPSAGIVTGIGVVEGRHCVIVGIVLMIVWSFWIGLIVALVGLAAFGGFAKGKWY